MTILALWQDTPLWLALFVGAGLAVIGLIGASAYERRKYVKALQNRAEPKVQARMIYTTINNRARLRFTLTNLGPHNLRKINHSIEIPSQSQGTDFEKDQQLLPSGGDLEISHLMIRPAPDVVRVKLIVSLIDADTGVAYSAVYNFFGVENEAVAPTGWLLSNQYSISEETVIQDLEARFNQNQGTAILGLRCGLPDVPAIMFVQAERLSFLFDWARREILFERLCLDGSVNQVRAPLKEQYEGGNIVFAISWDEAMLAIRLDGETYCYNG